MSPCRIVFLSYLIPLCFSFVCHFALVHCYDIVMFFPFSIKSFCRQGSVSELLLLLLSSWNNSVSRQPAVASVKCDPVSAVTVFFLHAPRCKILFSCHEYIGGMITVEKVGLDFEKEWITHTQFCQPYWMPFSSMPCHVIVFIFSCSILFG